MRATNKSSPRLAGGPKLPRPAHEFYTTNAQRLAKAEGLPKCSMTTLLTRLAHTGVDLVAIIRDGHGPQQNHHSAGNGAG